jgi:DNA-binding response OmpR family regulator
MPEMDGGEVMQRAWQLDPDLLIIILTAYATLDSAITAVKGGAADYLLKPCSLHDIQDSIARALQQRGEFLRQQRTVRQISDAMQALQVAPRDQLPTPSADATERYLRRGAVTLDRAARQAVLHRSGHGNVHDMHIELTAHQVALLNCLMEHADSAVSCRELALAALGTSVHESDAENIIRPHISRLRKKIEPDPAHPTVIRTVRGAGYQFASE